MSNKKVLEVDNLKVSFQSNAREIQAVRGVSFSIGEGEILGIVGESGSGKSVTMKAVLGILPENAKILSDKMLLNDRELSTLSDESYRKVRGAEMTMIFQDPMTALNPLMRIGEQIEEVILRHRRCSKAEARSRVPELLTQVGISMPEKRVRQYPHEFSGGMRQRVLIAMALACEPKLLIADEPTTALDVTIQAQILELLQQLKERYKMSIALITHDMGVVASMCNRIVIMYGGLVMEHGTVEEIFYDPKHPYTKALLRSIPTIDLAQGERLRSIPGLPPSTANPPIGCPFADRCEVTLEKCRQSLPSFEKHGQTHESACFLNEERGGK